MELTKVKPWSDPRYFYAAPTWGQAKQIAWQDLKDLISEMAPWCFDIASMSETDLSIRTSIGTSVHVVGMDKPHRIEGIGWDGGVMDECSDQRPKAFDLSVLPALADRNGWCWFIGVPKRQGSGAVEFKERYERAISGEDPDMAGFSWPSRDVLSADQIALGQRLMDPKDFREQFEASFETAGGTVYHSFDSEYNVRPCSYDPSQPILVGSDFNVSPMAWVLMHRYEKRRLEQFDEIFIRETNTQAVLEVLIGRYGSHRGGFQFYGDATGRARKTSASQSDYEIILNDERLKKLGRTVHYPAVNPSVSDRYAAVNALLCNAAGERNWFIDPNCRQTIRDLEGCYYNPGATEAAKTPGGDLTHLTDAAGYLIHYLHPLFADLGIPAPGRLSVTVGA